MQAFLRSDAFKISTYVVAVVLLGALLAPQLHALAQWALESGKLDTGPLASIKDSVERAQISRYFNRTVMVSALLLAWPFIRWIGIERGGSWLLLRKNPSRFAHFGMGFGIAAGTLLLLGGIYVAIDWYRMNDDAKPLYRMLLSSIGPGLSVAFLEEFLFRGVLFALILRTLRPMSGLIFLSVFFAIVHFLKPPDHLEFPPVAWDSGFWLLGKIFGQLGNVDFLLAELILLFCVGWVLGWARLKTGSLWLSIGLHAGWVFGIKLFSSATRKAVAIDAMLPWAGPNLRVGFNSVIVVCLCGIIVWFLIRRRYPESAFAPVEREH
ncbi:MAG: CPBP family intramembrane metalloprotease [Verrucomicrobiae bacterium]|nr:CPBP family intramembrane metalloprotease [Verrucomicrobiae bacterium]